MKYSPPSQTQCPANDFSLRNSFLSLTFLLWVQFGGIIHWRSSMTSRRIPVVRRYRVADHGKNPEYEENSLRAAHPACVAPLWYANFASRRIGQVFWVLKAGILELIHTCQIISPD